MKTLRSMFTLCVGTLLVATTILGCSDEETSTTTNNNNNPVDEPVVVPPGTPPLLADDCDPLVPELCVFPFPSSAYLVPDTTKVTGRRIFFGKTTLPKLPDGGHVDPTPFAEHDGFSPGQSLLLYFANVSLDGTATQDTLDKSISMSSPTLIVDAETGELIPHFVELDVTAPTPEESSLILRPVVRLKDARRYLVAIRGLKDQSGAEIVPSSAFMALRDGLKHEHPSVALRRDLYKDIFSILNKYSIGKENLQIAWDFWTASKENNTQTLIHMRDDALAKVGSDGPEYVIDTVTENPNANIRRRLEGRMTVPLYLDKAAPGGKIVRDAQGLPVQNGTAEFPFIVQVPNSATKGKPVAIIQNGHGLLGSRNEGRDGYLAEFCEKKQYVSISVDWAGMASEDQAAIASAVTSDIAKFQEAVDRQHQGILNHLLAMRMMKGRFVKEPLVQFEGSSAIDPTLSFYRGDSQGGIFGTTYMAISTDVTRGLLGEPGFPYNLLLTRSVDFGPFFVLLRATYMDSLDVRVAEGLAQILWDRTEPDGYAPYIRENMLPNTPAHEVLIHVAIGDYQVTPLGAHLLARTIGAKNLAPVNRSIWGIEEVAGPLQGSAMVEFSFGLPEAPKTNLPPAGPGGDDPHDKVRVLNAAYDMSDIFFRTGVVQATCMGPCDPE
jgi:hypothetical protein